MKSLKANLKIIAYHLNWPSVISSKRKMLFQLPFTPATAILDQQNQAWIQENKYKTQDEQM